MQRLQFEKYYTRLKTSLDYNLLWSLVSWCFISLNGMFYQRRVYEIQEYLHQDYVCYYEAKPKRSLGNETCLAG